MRNIMFRAMKLGEKGTWLVGDLRFHQKDTCIYEKGGNKGLPVIEETIGEYSGIDDIDGKHIYEDDIIQTEAGLTFMVIFEKGLYTAKVFKCDSSMFLKEYSLYFLTQKFKVKVIGNIHENND